MMWNRFRSPLVLGKMVLVEINQAKKDGVYYGF